MQRALENYKNELASLNKQEHKNTGNSKPKKQELAGQANVGDDDAKEEENLYDLIMHDVLEASSKSYTATGESRRNWQFHAILLLKARRVARATGV